MPSTMHSSLRPHPGMFTLKTLGAAVAAALVFSSANAAGLGKLTVLSSLGQPLRAEIELTAVSANEAGALAVKLASLEAFQQAEVNFNSALSSLRFSVEKRGERQYIRVNSSQPLNEPFVEMLLELSGPNGRLVREYTFLLDPVDLSNGQAAQTAATGPIREAVSPQQVEKPQPPQTAPIERTVAARVQQQPAAGEARADEYRVRKGDTLARIAGQMKANGVSLDQMLVALYKANPDAFAGQNMNRLKAGQILSVPDAEAARSISNGEARSIIVAQAADFNAYRSKLAGQVATAAPQIRAESRQSAGGKITAKVVEPPTPANEAKDKLKPSSAGPVPVPAPAAGAAATEDKIAKEKAVAEANARVRELEKNVGDLQQLLEVKNKGLAEQQKQADAAKAEEKPASAAPAPAAITTPSTPATAATPETSVVAPNEAKPAVSPAPVVAKPKPAAPAPVPEPSFFDEVMNNPLVLPGLGALLVALGALGVYRARRQKQAKPFEDSIIADASLKTNSLFGSTGGQSVDTSNSLFNSSFAPSASQLDTNEVDPVAEADVYIAYGRDAQAEEILKEALRTQPERHAVRVKLLEIYSNRKDARAFEVLATELYGMTKGEGDDWAQAVTMGAALDPGNPLYAGGRGEQAARSDFVAPTRPLEEQGLATLLASTQPDTYSLEALDTLAADTPAADDPSPAEKDAPAPAIEPVIQPVIEPADAQPVAFDRTAPQASSNEMDFDLDGIDLPDMVAPNTIPRPAPAEPPTDLASIDFDFLDEPAAPAPQPAAEPAAAPAGAVPVIQDLEFSLDDTLTPEPPNADELLASDDTATDGATLDFNLPGFEDTQSEAGDVTDAEAQAQPAPAAAQPLNFDLSSIDLDLPPAADAPPSEPAMSSPEAFMLAEEDMSSNSAEMATKLDLALAYREIGDKEGARELLDEVLKGGTPEQSEKAKSLLLELA